MPLTPGTRLGVYEITARIGEGGMGQVYRATDTTLGRQVAIKILPDVFAADPERLARFEREAKTLASLSHPHIAAIYAVEKSAASTSSGQAGMHALVMELVEGDDLSERIARGPVPLDETLAVGKQIAEALEAAHEQGVIHRDLKPANIKVRPDGTVKVLDFGLAKALDPAGAASGSVSQSPTITSPAMTQAGMILGTAAYMAPEQARGKAVDKRADNWAFGCVLFEMLSGTRPFGGHEVADVLAHVLAKEPDWKALPDNLPPIVRQLIVRCLAKDPRQRLHDMADARLDIQDAIAARLRGEPVADTAVVRRTWPWGAMAVVGAIALIVGLGAGWAFRSAPPLNVQVARASLGLNPADELGTDSILGMLPGGSRSAVAWSPDGRTLAFIGTKGGTRQIYLRDLDGGAARPLEGTQAARALAYSADGDWVAFWAAGEVRKIRVAGGPPSRISAAAEVNGITWGPTRIIYTTRTQIFEVSPAGGEPRALNELKFRVSSPFLLPGETALLYTEYEKTWTSGDERVMVKRLNSGDPPTVLVREAADARYLPTGHLAYLRQGTIFIVPFDRDALEVRGDEVAVLNEVAQAVASWSGQDLTLAGQFAVSSQGTLAYVASPPPSFPTSDLVAVSRTGQITPLPAPPNTYRERIETSPDGTKVAVSVQTAKNIRLFLYDILRGTLEPFAESGSREAVRPIWSSGGRIAVHYPGEVIGQLAVFRPDSPASSETATASGNFAPSSWSPAGDVLIGSQAGDLWTYTPGSTASTWVQRTKTPAIERFPVWSPDGKWLAYASNVSGRDEIYVESYPGPGTAIPVSTNGGLSPAWNPNGRELFYAEPREGEQGAGRMMSASMGDPRAPGKPILLFPFSSESLLMAACSPTTCYSVARDGQSFFTLRMRPRQPPKVTSLQVVFNWFEELRRLGSTN